MIARVPLADRKDDWIERWLRAPPAARPEARLVLPDLGKPAFHRRGAARAAPEVAHRRRVVVIAYHYRMGGAGYARLHAHLSYLERPDAGEAAAAAALFDASEDEAPARAGVAAWRDDRHHFRIVLAPDDGHRLDMKAFTRAYMAELEKALGTRLSWFAGIHEKADAAHRLNRHAHIVLRGIDDRGADLVMSRDFIRYEMRRLAEDLATRHLGRMSQREFEAYQARQAGRADGRTYHAGYRPRSRSRGMEHD